MDEARRLLYCEGFSSGSALHVLVTGHNLTYQWYKNDVAIPGANEATYTITAMSAQYEGRYHLEVSDGIESLKSVSYEVSLKPEIISQRWNDVLFLNLDPLTNGGYFFSYILWYINGNPLNGETFSYLEEASGLRTGAAYHVTAQSQYGDYESCVYYPITVPNENVSLSVYPNPVRAGEEITIEGASSAQSIRLYNLLGDFLSEIKPSTAAKMSMPNVTGIYLLQIRLDATNIKIFTIIVR
jgi:hypothetical protein